MSAPASRAAGPGTESRKAGKHLLALINEVLDLARGKIGIYVDIKSATAQDLVSHIDGHGMTDHVVMYCGPNLCKQIQSLNPKLAVMPESNTVEHTRMLVDLLHPRVIAFGQGDFKRSIICF